MAWCLRFGLDLKRPGNAEGNASPKERAQDMRPSHGCKKFTFVLYFMRP